MLDFARNYNAYGPPEGTLEVLQNHTARITRYSHPQDISVREAYAQYLGVELENIAHGVGATAILYELPNLFHGKGANIFAPSFWEYSEVNKRARRSYDTIELDEAKDFAYDLELISDRLSAKPSTLYLCNPNNPTSQLCTKQNIIKVAENHPDTDIVVDETYLLFREDYPEQSVVPAVLIYDNIHVVLSLSKLFTVPGIRSGVFVSNKANAAAFRKLQVPHTTNSLTEAIVPWLLQQKDFIAKSRRFYSQKRPELWARLKETFKDALHILPAQANFILAKNLTDDDRDIAQYLLTQNIEVREGGHLDPRLERWFRFSIRKDNENMLLVQGLKSYFSSTGTS